MHHRTGRYQNYVLRDRLKKLFIPVLCVLFLSFSDNHAVTGTMSPDALKEDISALRRALEKYHPGLYWYTSKEEFNRTWDSLNMEVARPMTALQFFKALLPVVAKVKCAHTLFYPSHNLMSSGSRFPLDVKFIGDKVYGVSDNSNQNLIPNGSEFIAINGRPINEVVSLLFRNLEAQGGNIGWKHVILENDFQNYYYYIIEQTDSFRVEYVDPETSEKKHAIIIGGTQERLRKHWKNWYPESDGPPLGIRYRDDKSTAIISVKSFSPGRLKSYHQNFDELTGRYFNEIKEKGVQNLIIDIRGNEGGNQPEKLFAYIDKGKKNSFRGSVTVLMNEESISAQESFVSIFKFHNRGLTIGRPTPGCMKYLCGGKKHKLVLPNSKFQLNIPMHPSIRVNPDTTIVELGKGYQPDHYVEDDINALLRGEDAVMEFALNKINTHGNH
jgi:hypothetical protein